MKCEVCQQQRRTKSSIIHDVYYKAICTECYAKLMTMETPSSGHAEYNRGRDAEEHEAEIRQPYNGDGKPDAEFIRLYPDTASKMFSEDEIKRAMRS